MNASDVQSQRMQDEEITKAGQWMLVSNPDGVVTLFQKLNDAGEDKSLVRTMTDHELDILRGMALIGWFEAVQSCRRLMEAMSDG